MLARIGSHWMFDIAEKTKVTTVLLGKYTFNLDMGDALSSQSKIRRFFLMNPQMLTWLQANISGFSESKLGVTFGQFKTYDELEVWMPLDNDSDLTLWKLRPDWEQHEHI